MRSTKELLNRTDWTAKEIQAQRADMEERERKNARMQNILALKDEINHSAIKQLEQHIATDRRHGVVNAFLVGLAIGLALVIGVAKGRGWI